MQNNESDSSDDDDWRDPHIHENGGSSFYDNSLSQVSVSQPSATPDDCWALPSHCNSIDIIGPKNARTNEIRRLTGVYISYNRSLHQVDLWGDPVAIVKAKEYLNGLSQRISQLDTTMLRKTKKWSRPDREMTEKEKIREDKREQRMREEKRYMSKTTEKQRFNSTYYIPKGSIPIKQLMGPNECYMNQIRADCKTYIQHDPQGHTFRLSSNDPNLMHMAAIRLRNWHLKNCRVPKANTARLMQQPSQNLLLKYRKLPSMFVLSEYVLSEKEDILREKQRIFDTITTGCEQTNRDLINSSDAMARPHKNELPEEVTGLDQYNEQTIQTLLDVGLESLRLKDWAIRMKIRFGTICLIDFPRKDGVNLTIEQVCGKLFKKEKFKSALAPCISKSRASLAPLFDYLNRYGEEYSNNPKKSFGITANQYASTISAKERKKRDANLGPMWRTYMDFRFDEKGERGLWNTVTQCTDLVDISCFEPENPYSWDIKLQYARSFPRDGLNAPQELFSENLRLSPSGRLIVPSILDYIPESVSQKTKWLYSWCDFIVEICKEEFWDLDRIGRKDDGLPLDMSNIEPHRVLFKVSMYKESWLNRFADNLCLEVGEAPSWTIKDFLALPDENVHTLIHSIKKFGKVLAQEVPLYYNQSSGLFN